MDRYFQFILFFTILLSIFGFMQWYVLRAYVEWLTDVAGAHIFKRLRSVGLLVLAIGNVMFLLRFPSTDLNWYQDPLFQSLVIYPGGIFFGAVTMAFLILLLFDSGARLKSMLRVLMSATRLREFAIRLRQLFRKSPSLTEVVGNQTDNKIHSDFTPLPDNISLPDNASSSPESFSLQNESSFNDLLSRRQFLRTTGAAMITAPLGVTIGAAAATAHDYQINRLRLAYPGLPSGLNGLRIVQLSDIHSGIYMTENQMRDIFHLANEQHPDLVAITGDFVDNSVSEIPALYRAITDLKAGYGIYGCLGNHDHYASAKAVSSALLQRGVHLLTNSHMTIPVNGESVTLLGVDDIQSGTSNPERMGQALNHVPDDRFRILLSHRPDLFDHAREHKIDLTLAGHTHGGQIGFNLMGIPLYPIHLFHDYAKGLYEVGDHKLYVNVGIGMVGVPVRLVRPELTVIELSNTV